MRPKPAAPTRESAETLALQVLGWIASDDDRLGRFLDLTGIAPSELRGRLNDPATLAGVLDFLLGDEGMLLAFCEDSGHPPTLPAACRLHLPGQHTWE